LNAAPPTGAAFSIASRLPARETPSPPKQPGPLSKKSDALFGFKKRVKAKGWSADPIGSEML